MSVEFRCDWCGERIEEGESWVWVSARVDLGDEDETRYHYHDEHWAELQDYADFNRRARLELGLLPTCEEPPEPGAEDRRIYELPIDPGAKAALVAAGIKTVAQLLERTAEDLLGIRGISWRRLEAIERILKGCGLRLAVAEPV